MSIGLVHCICGPVAAGKSTLARELASANGGVRFAIDEWMHSLYGPDRPERLDMGWVAPRVARCHRLMWSVALQVLCGGREVVVEPGLMTRAEREAFRAQVRAAGHRVRMHFVDAPRDVRLARLARRNQERGDTFAFEVTPAMFDFMDARYEPALADELGGDASDAPTPGV